MTFLFWSADHKGDGGYNGNPVPPYPPLKDGVNSMAEVTAKTIEAVIREALRRYEAGRLEHGQLDLATQRRDFLQEA